MRGLLRTTAKGATVLASSAVFALVAAADILIPRGPVDGPKVAFVNLAHPATQVPAPLGIDWCDVTPRC